MRPSHLVAVVTLALAALGPAAGCAAPTSEETTAGSEDAVTATERQTIMDALRAKVRPELRNQDIVFDVSQGSFKATKEFAFLTGQIRLKSNGRPVDYMGTAYADDIREGIFDDHIDAFLRKVNGKWTVKAHAIGSTDVAWLGWSSEMGAPASIFPFAPAVDPAKTARAEAMDSLRAKLKPTLRNQDIVFVVSAGVGTYQAKADWVFLRGQIRLRGSGRPVDDRGTEYQQDIDDGLFDDGFGALLHKENGKFVVKAVAVGPSDVAWTGWDAEFGAPTAIFR